jgi:Spy/CpxP family protein refolding chaperone
MKALLPLVLLFAVTACATKKDVLEVEKKAQEVTVTDSKGLGNTIQETIANSTTLSEAQKKQLVDIFAANKAKAEELSAESYKYRSLLITELLSGEKINTKGIRIIKRDIKRIEAARMKNTFDTVEKVSKVVQSQADKKVFREQMIIMERSVR